MAKLSGKKALITGGSSGIGLATALLFAEHGARVAITGRNPSSLDQALQKNNDLLLFRSDAGKLQEIDSLMEQVGAAFNKVDVLFVNAGVAHAAPFELITETQFDEMVSVDFKGVFFTIQKALPFMNEGASIIVNTSITNQMGSPNFSVYGACKAALRSLVKSLGLELSAKGVRINAVSPGPISTRMYSRVGLPAESEAALKSLITEKSPAQRFGNPDEVAKAVLFLASDDSSYVVGDELVVDGGMCLL